MWTIRVEGFRVQDIVHNGNRFLIGNGYMGYRGTLEEFRADAFVGLNLPGVYDQVGDKWRESVNAPNPLFTDVIMNGQRLHSMAMAPTSHMQELEMKTGLHRRKTTYELNGQTVTLLAERFTSMKQEHVLAMKYTVMVTADTDLVIRTGIDHHVWDLNGPHLEDVTCHHQDGALIVQAITHELKLPVLVGEIIDFKACEPFVSEIEVCEEDGLFYRKLSVHLKPNQPFTFYKYAWIYHGKEEIELVSALQEIKTLGYDTLFQEHQSVWEEKWRRADVTIAGDEEAQISLRYSIYHLLILTPRNDRVSIPARGISGQTYKGAVFWDTEIFMLPFYLNTDVEAAKRLIRYRIHTLEGARRKAKEYGYRGAFYAWESQETGDDACSLFNVTDVFTNRPIRTYFRDKQIHINGAVVYALWETYRRTKDLSLLTDGGLEVIMECARFYFSYAYYNHILDRYEILDVTGPDEYHERVHNNAYTNRIVYETFSILEQATRVVKQKAPDVYDRIVEQLGFKEEYQRILDMRDKLYLPQPNEDLVIEQFDRYFTLEDVSLDTVRSRLVHPNEYWGGTNGVATNTQIIKQADVVTMLYLFSEDYSLDVKRANWAYYEPRTEHGSSLSASMYALVACEIGKPDWAYPYFMKTATVDLSGESKQFAGGIYIGGTHPAANGGAYLTAIYGFAGVRLKEGQLMVNPRLPRHWKGMAFSIRLCEGWYRVVIERDHATIVKEDPYD